MCFEIIDDIENIETVAVGGRIRDIMKHTNKNILFVLCIENKDCDDLEKRKVYQVLPDDKAADEGYLRIVEVSGFLPEADQEGELLNPETSCETSRGRTANRRLSNTEYRMSKDGIATLCLLNPKSKIQIPKSNNPEPPKPEPLNPEPLTLFMVF